MIENMNNRFILCLFLYCYNVDSWVNRVIFIKLLELLMLNFFLWEF